MSIHARAPALALLLAAPVTWLRSFKAPKPADPGAWMDSDAAMAEAIRKANAEKAARDRGES